MKTFLDMRINSHGHLFEHERCLEDGERIPPNTDQPARRDADTRFVLANHLHSIIALRWQITIQRLPAAAQWHAVISRELLSRNADLPDTNLEFPDNCFYKGLEHAASCGIEEQGALHCDLMVPDGTCRIFHAIFVKYVLSHAHTITSAFILYSTAADFADVIQRISPVLSPSPYSQSLIPTSIPSLYTIMYVPLSYGNTVLAWQTPPPLSKQAAILAMFINRQLTLSPVQPADAGPDAGPDARPDSHQEWWTSNTMDALDDGVSREPLVVRVFLQGVKLFHNPDTPLYRLVHQFIVHAMHSPTFGNQVFDACACPFLVLAANHASSYADLQDHCQYSARVLQYHDDIEFNITPYYHALRRVCAACTPQPVSVDAALAVSFGLANTFAEAEAALARIATETADSPMIIEQNWPQSPTELHLYKTSSPRPYQLPAVLSSWSQTLQPHPLYPNLSLLTILFSRRTIQFLKHPYLDDLRFPVFLPTVASAITAYAVAATVTDPIFFDWARAGDNGILDDHMAAMCSYVSDCITPAQFVHLFDTLLHDRVVALNCPICTYAIALFVLIPDVYFNTPEVDARRNYQTAVVARLLLHTPNLVCLLLAALWDSRAPQIHATLFPTSRYIGHNAFELNFLFNNTVQPVATDVHALRLRLQNQVLSSPSLLDSLASPADAESIKASFRRMRVIRSQDTAPLVRCPHCTPPPYCRS
jgi:hypothetical protein